MGCWFEIELLDVVAEINRTRLGVCCKCYIGGWLEMEVVSWRSYDINWRNALSRLTRPLKEQKTLCDACLVDLRVSRGGHGGIFCGLLGFSRATLTIIFLGSLAVQLVVCAIRSLTGPPL